MRNHFALLPFALLPVLANAQAGTLDPTFDGDGILQLDLMPNGDSGYDGLPTNDGRLYVCGYLDNGPQDGAFLTRLLDDGSTDPAFGLVTLPSGSNGRAFRLAFAPDSAVYVCGYADTLGYETFTLWRVLASGAVDPAFGLNGRSSVQIGFSDARTRGLAVQADGKVVLAGYESAGFGRDGVLVRLLPDGSPDPGFSGDGIMVLTNFSDLDQLDAVTQLADGSIVAGGYAEVNGDDRALLVKVNTNGALDLSFGTQGALTPSFSTSDSRVYGVAAMGTEVLAAGVMFNSLTSADLFLTKRASNGAADITFGTLGVAEIDVFDDDWMDDMELLADGRIVFTGYTGSTAPGGDIDFLLGCYQANGQPDGGFGTNGIVVTETSPNYEGGFGVCAQPDGKVVVVGFGGVIGNSSLVVLRYTNDLTTGVLTTAEGIRMRPYPIPASEQLMLELPEAGAYRIDLIDAAGRTVRTWSTTGSMMLSLDVSSLPAGPYSMRLTGRVNGTARVLIAR